MNRIHAFIYVTFQIVWRQKQSSADAIRWKVWMMLWFCHAFLSHTVSTIVLYSLKGRIECVSSANALTLFSILNDCKMMSWLSQWSKLPTMFFRHFCPLIFMYELVCLINKWIRRLPTAFNYGSMKTECRRNARKQRNTIEIKECTFSGPTTMAFVDIGCPAQWIQVRISILHSSVGKWLDDEKERFIKALELFPKDWDKITEYVSLCAVYYHRLGPERSSKSKAILRNISNTWMTWYEMD